MKLVNLGCGDTFCENWINLDYSPAHSSVKQANLLSKLPFENEFADIVYSSHFLEHIPLECVNPFLCECYRVLKLGGTLRIVLPDWQEMCASYLKLRETDQHEKADFLIVEMIDQCVRQKPGGRLGELYNYACHSNSDVLKAFIRERTGYDVNSICSMPTENKIQKFIKSPHALITKIERLYCKVLVSALPKAFRQQNVSFAGVGEKHQWMYDFYTVSKSLEEVGFIEMKKYSANTSSIKEFPFHPLDLHEDGRPRKGNESMYIEALKK